MARRLFEWDYSTYPGAPMEEVALCRERMFQAILEDVRVFFDIPLKIGLQKAIARGQGETVMRLYKAC